MTFPALEVAIVQSLLITASPVVLVKSPKSVALPPLFVWIKSIVFELPDGFSPPNINALSPRPELVSTNAPLPSVVYSDRPLEAGQ